MWVFSFFNLMICNSLDYLPGLPCSLKINTTSGWYILIPGRLKSDWYQPANWSVACCLFVLFHPSCCVCSHFSMIKILMTLLFWRVVLTIPSPWTVPSVADSHVHGQVCPHGSPWPPTLKMWILSCSLKTPTHIHLYMCFSLWSKQPSLIWHLEICLLSFKLSSKAISFMNLSWFLQQI